MGDNTAKDFSEALDRVPPEYKITRAVFAPMTAEYAARGAVAIDTVLLGLTEAVMTLEGRLITLESKIDS